LKTKTKVALGFVVTGFLVGAILCACTFYWNSKPARAEPPIPDAVYLLLCPPSLASMALDNAGTVGGLIGWFLISLENSVVYGLIGVGVGTIVERKLN
jgi:hypothetical protein